MESEPAKPKTQQDNSKAKKLLDVTSKLREMAEKLFSKKEKSGNNTTTRPTQPKARPSKSTKQKIDRPEPEIYTPDIYVTWATADGKINCENFGAITMREAEDRLSKIKDIVAKTFTDIYPSLETLPEVEIKRQLRAMMYRKYLTEKK